jgi:predicted ATPase
MPEKLYGREHETAILLASFDRVVKSGAPELVLVSGYSGIGKSSVVNELHKVLAPSRSLFAFGKFDQYKRDIPYATFAQAFQGLVRQLLSKNDAELSGWRDALTHALGPNGQLMSTWSRSSPSSSANSRRCPICPRPRLRAGSFSSSDGF